MLQLIELIEQFIEKEMKATKGALLQDAWTDSGTHYIVIFAL